MEFLQVEWGLQALMLVKFGFVWSWECGSQWLQGLAIILGNATILGGRRFLSLALQKAMQG